jgi:hypothetical protein
MNKFKLKNSYPKKGFNKYPKKGFNKNWLIRKYNTSAFCYDSYEILNRYEWEAQHEAESECERDTKCDDWTMTAITK